MRKENIGFKAWSNEQLEEIKEKLEKAADITEFTGLHHIVLYWIDLFDTINFRDGYFTDYTEARLFADDLKEKYGKMNPSNWGLTFDGSLYCSRYTYNFDF